MWATINKALSSCGDSGTIWGSNRLKQFYSVPQLSLTGITQQQDTSLVSMDTFCHPNLMIPTISGELFTWDMNKSNLVFTCANAFNQTSCETCITCGMEWRQDKDPCLVCLVVSVIVLLLTKQCKGGSTLSFTGSRRRR